MILHGVKGAEKSECTVYTQAGLVYTKLYEGNHDHIQSEL